MAEAMSPDELLELKLTADGRGSLLPLLRAAEGAVLNGRYRIDRLLAAGRQSFVFAATDRNTGGEVVVKQTAFDYRKPIRYGAKRIQELRRGLQHEFEVLQSAPAGYFPQPIALVTGPAIVPAAERNFALHQDELFLVEEKIDGNTLRELGWRAWRSLAPTVKEQIAKKLAADVWRFWEELGASGWFYTDLSPTNLIVERTRSRLRIVDAGSVVRVSPMVTLTGYTPAFTTPNLLEAFVADRAIAATPAVVLPMLAKILHFFLTLREPINGLLPALDFEELNAYSPMCRTALQQLLDLDAFPERVDPARKTLLDWTDAATTLSYPSLEPA